MLKSNLKIFTCKPYQKEHRPKMDDKDRRIFIDHINRQLIFNTYITPNKDEKESILVGKNRLVCRNNLDLFFSNNNMIRCCTINSEYGNYRLLNKNGTNYEIKTLEINSLGTLLALIGDESIEVVTIPVSLTSTQEALLPVKSYTIEGLKGKIKKVLWHPIVANDGCLVVLNDESQISMYDISISNSRPLSVIDCKKFDEFRNDDVQSICLGSCASLSSSMTLYIKTYQGKLFAICPYIPPESKLALTKEMVKDFLKELTIFLNTSEESSGAADAFQLTKQSYLKRACIRQYEFACYLLRQMNNMLALAKEYRNILSDSPSELYKLSHCLPETSRPVLQGPLFTKLGLAGDIANVSNNGLISIIVSAGKSENESFKILYLAQLKPLIMRWSQEDDVLPSYNKTEKHSSNGDKSLPVQKSKPVDEYVKPAKGFGFIDICEFSDSQPALENQDARESTPNEEKESHMFWNQNFLQISTLLLDELPLNSPLGKALIKATEQDGYFFLSGDEDLLIVDFVNWMDQFNNCIKVNNPPDLNLNPKYSRVLNSPNGIDSYAIVSDEITDTGKYLIAIKSDKNKSLHVKNIIKKESLPKLENKPFDVKIQQNSYSSVLKKEPFIELSEELEGIKEYRPPSYKDYPYDNPEAFKKDLKSNDVSVLGNLNTLSSSVLNQCSKLNIYAIHLNMRLINQVEELKNQIHMLDIIGQTPSRTAVDDKMERVQKLAEKQETLREKMELAQRKVYDSIEKLYFTQNLPLSNAEKAWFKELNSITRLLDSNFKEGLVGSLSDIKKQVAALTKGQNSVNSETIEDKLDIYHTRAKTSKLKNWLLEEDRIIKYLNGKLEELNQKVDKKIVCN